MKRKEKLATDFDREWKNRFTRFAEENEDDAGIAGWSQSGLDIRLRRFGALCQMNGTPGHWIDAGCGAGTYSRFLAERNKDVIALDYSFKSVNKAKNRSQTNKILWLVGAIQGMPLRDHAYEGGLCFGVTQAVKDQLSLLLELHRVLASEGTLWIDGLNVYCIPHLYNFLVRFVQNKPLHEHFQSPWNLRETMNRCGFSRIELIWIPILPKRFQKYQPYLETKFVTNLFHKFPILGALFSHTFFLVGTKSDS